MQSKEMDLACDPVNLNWLEKSCMKKNLKPKNEGTVAKRPVHYRTILGRDQRTQTRALIIDAAIHVFAEMGPDAPVIDDFTKAAGVSRSNFYNYFRTTEELLKATIEVVSSDLVNVIDPLIKDIENPVLRTATAARHYYQRAVTDRRFAAFITSSPKFGTLAEKRVRRDLTEARKMKLIAVDNMDVAFAVFAGTMNYAIQALAHQGKRPVKGEKVVQAMLAGLGAPQPLIEQALKVPLKKVKIDCDT